MAMTKQEKEAMIQQAAQAAFDAGVEPEMEPVSRHLQAAGHPYGRDFCFVLCVATDIGHMHARAEGYRDQWDRAGQRYAAKARSVEHA